MNKGVIMPEFRQNQASKEWVILAPERGMRPSDFRESRPKPQILSAYRTDCPFCKGNDKHIVTPVLSVPGDGDWQVRVVPNKFAALQSDTSPERRHVGGFLSANGFGIAEVVIEHPMHNRTIGTMTVSEVTQILWAYHARQVEISKNEKINLVMIFRNHGNRAGTSLEHPHSLIIATPIVPPHIRYPIDQAVLHYDKYGKCVFCDMLAEELRQRSRIIVESEHFVAFCPFAARSPFETRIYPRRHMASYVSITDVEVDDLARILRTVMGKLYVGLHNPDYNYIIRSSPIGDEDTRYLHWYFVIIPKITISAGFEIGSGIYINTTAPEESAEYLREVNET